MVILRSQEIREMEIGEIEKKLDELKAEYAKNISKSSAAGVNENPGKIKELKTTIARVLTIINEKKYGEEK
jgi:large subunit ribosomal protein L29